ncbi:MAG: hypothetical protein ACYS29_10005, partial [Planctomycetota bacterium]
VQIHGNAEVYVEEDFRLGNPGQAAGKAPATATMTMTGGTLNADRVRLGWRPYNPADFSCTVDMSGGLIVARSDLQIGEKTTVNLTGGEIRIGSGDSLDIDVGGKLDICGGVLKIRGNHVFDIMMMLCEGYLGGITCCGSTLCCAVEYDGTWTIIRYDPDCDADADQAYCPNPPDGAENVRSALTEVCLEWTNGGCLGTRGRACVLFGSDCSAIENAGCCEQPIGPCYEFWTIPPRLPPAGCVGNLPLWTTYCWRVDQWCQDATCVKGKVWRFTTGCEDIPGDCNRDCILNFEDYAATVDDFGQKIYWP